MEKVNDLNIGLEKPIREKSCELLSHILANEYILYLETLNFHWNITGENFIGLHQLLETHYEWLKSTIDEIAERIRSLGFEAPATYRKYHQNTSLQETKDNLTAKQMLSQLVDAHCKQIRELREKIAQLGETQDYSTQDLLIKMLGEHEQKTWMLRSHLLKHPNE